MNKLIFGYTWEQIQKAQQGGTLQSFVPFDIPQIVCTKEDIALFEEYGESGLKEKQFYGVIDRLAKAGIITEG